MRILLLNQVFYPDTAATAQHLTDLACYLKEAGAEVTVVCSARHYTHNHIRHPAKEIFKGIKVFRVFQPGFKKSSFQKRIIDSLFLEIGLLWRVMTLPQQDYVIAFTSPPLVSVIGAFFCALRGGKLISWLMDINPDAAVRVGYLKEDSLATRGLRTLLRWTLRKSSQVVVLDKFMKSYVHEKYGVSQDKLLIIPPWPIFNLKKDEKEALKFRDEHKLTEKFIVMYSGNHSIVHPLDPLLEAALKLKEQSDIVFLFVGGGLRTHDVTCFKQKHSLSNILQLPAQSRESVGGSLSAADLHTVVLGDRVNGLVHPSKIYGIFSVGKPALFIGPRKSHLAELHDHFNLGFFSESNDLSHITELILKVKSLSRSELKSIEENEQDFLNQNMSRTTLLSNLWSTLT